MAEINFNSIKLDQIPEVIDSILKLGENLAIWTFTGNLGAGKTTLIKALAQKNGIKEDISSPTFNYVNNYEGKVYHFDCYRINSIEEALNFGFEEYFDSGKRCWIEWAEVVKPLFQESYLEIVITHNPDASRNYKIFINQA